MSDSHWIILLALSASVDGLRDKSTGFEPIYAKSTGHGGAEMLKLDVYRYLSKLRFIRVAAEKLAGFIKRLDDGDAEEVRHHNNAGSVGKLIEKIPAIRDMCAYHKANLGEMTEPPRTRYRRPILVHVPWSECQRRRQLQWPSGCLHEAKPDRQADTL